MKEINSYGFNMADDTRKVRVEERLKIKIGESNYLHVKQRTCQDATMEQHAIETSIVPFFGEEFQFEVPRRFRYLSIYVFDRDKHLKQDKVLGKVAIKREDLHRYNNKDHWFALRPVDADSEVQGKAYIELTLEDSRKRLRVEPKPPDPDPTGAAQDTYSTKSRGNNLVRLSEYCKESMGFGAGASSTSKKMLSPVATEPSLALSRSESLKERAQWIRSKPPMHTMSESEASPSPTAADYWSDPERHCAARVGHDTLRLRVLECSELTTKNGQCDPFALVTLLYSNGRRVERRTKPKKKTVNPQFDEIFCFDLVMDSDPKDKDGSQSAGVACEARVSVWHDAATPVFLGEVRLQLRQPAPTPMRACDATTIFRGNTLVSKMMDEAMRLSGASYLRAVLRPTLAAVLAERKPCEIDPARVKPSAAISANLANLKDYVEKVFGAITSSYAMCPAIMCRLFDALRQCAARHFPRNAEDPQTNRTLTLISKTIQSLGNLVSSRSAQQVCKEEYMAELYRSFCTPRHVQSIKQFLEIISTSTDTQNNNIQETPVLLKEGGELSWSRCGARTAAHKLPLSGVLAVAPVDCPPAGAPLGASNIFQIVHRERVLFVQASNCVERAEWVRLLSALCRHSAAAQAHAGYYADTHWTCCGRPEAEADGCGGGDPAESAQGPAALALRLDPARDLQRLHALLVSRRQRGGARGRGGHAARAAGDDVRPGAPTQHLPALARQGDQVRQQLSTAEAPPKRIERSQTAVTIPARPAHSSIVANLKFLSLHRYGAPSAGAGEAGGEEVWPAPPPPAHRPSATNDIRL
ncbi:GTPase-activating protein [Operophtera brumata]|uniref:GTPase-activating protein n=1 Tax=Operophtera brumata TaxID=104452 RepID=A0A0L7LPG6_OPEBR|nr:GTPase-activating protein [Operophtera brumata]